MPIYEYICQKCENILDITRSYNEQEIVPECIQCGSEMKRSYGSIGIQFKGSGFYKTDNPK